MKIIYSIMLSVKKDKKNIYTSNVQVTFEIDGHFRCLQFF